MHRMIGTSAVVAGMIIVVLAARHGYVSSGAPASGVVATIFTLFAIGGLFGPAFAVYLWKRSRACSILVGFLALAALGATLSITLGAIQVRADEPRVERIVEPIAEPIAEPYPIVEPVKVADPFAEDRDALDRIKRELASLRDHDMITAAVVEAAKAVAAAATESREAACSSNSGGQSNRCSQRESDERLALGAVAEAKENRAATERVNALRVELAMIQRRLAEAPPPVIKTRRAQAPPPEDLLTKAPERTQFFQVPDVADVTSATWQKFALAAFLELLIAYAFVAFELMRPKALQRAASSLKLLGRVVSRGRAVSAQTPTRRIYEYADDRLEKQVGTEVAFCDVYRDYKAWCQHHLTSVLTPYDFADRVARIFRGTDVFTRERNEIIQLVNVRLAGST
ncbi:MAG: hypothetical protein GY877_02245 [Hyphomicrobium sp.]|nr:hypothetical protein [Hyphomicrobium sp.]